MLHRMVENQGMDLETLGGLPVGPLTEQRILEMINFDDSATGEIEEAQVEEEGEESDSAKDAP